MSSTPPAATSRNAGYRNVSDTCRRKASARWRSAAIASRIGTKFPDASPTRVSATYIGGNTVEWCEIASAKLSPARIAAVTFFAVERMRPISESAASNSKASLILTPVRSSKARSPVKTVTSSGRGRENSAKPSPRLIGAIGLLGDRVDGNQTEIFDTSSDLRRGRRRDRPADDLADLAQGPVAEGRHCLTGWS